MHNYQIHHIPVLAAHRSCQADESNQICIHINQHRREYQKWVSTILSFDDIQALLLRASEGKGKDTGHPIQRDV